MTWNFDCIMMISWQLYSRIYLNQWLQGTTAVFLIHLWFVILKLMKKKIKIKIPLMYLPSNHSDWHGSFWDISMFYLCVGMWQFYPKKKGQWDKDKVRLINSGLLVNHWICKVSLKRLKIPCREYQWNFQLQECT